MYSNTTMWGGRITVVELVSFGLTVHKSKILATTDLVQLSGVTSGGRFFLEDYILWLSSNKIMHPVINTGEAFFFLCFWRKELCHDWGKPDHLGPLLTPPNTLISLPHPETWNHIIVSFNIQLLFESNYVAVRWQVGLPNNVKYASIGYWWCRDTNNLWFLCFIGL